MPEHAVIGGTGLEKLGERNGEKRVVATPFGDAEIHCSRDGVAFVSRHRADHSLAPHRVNFRANVHALSALGVKNVVAVYAVGSITDALPPGTAGVVADFIDFSGRGGNTFFDGAAFPLKHADMTRLVCEPLAERFARAARECGLPLRERRGVYAMTAGPRLETPAEIRALRALGADFVGMTMGTEAPLCVEAGMRFLPIAFSVNWAAGVEKRDDVGFISDEETAEISEKITRAAVRALLS